MRRAEMESAEDEPDNDEQSEDEGDPLLPRKLARVG
jgi:hypothetical protein